MNTPPEREAGLPVVRIGIVAGTAGMLCCVGPTVLALIGVLSATTALDLANGLYGSYAWYFRGFGLLVALALIAHVLKRRSSCNLAGVRSASGNIALTLTIGVGAYAFLYALTTWLGSFA